MRSPQLAGSVLLHGVLLTCALAQGPSHTPPLTEQADLAEILVRLQANQAAYLHNVPNFFCDEHVVSKLKVVAKQTEISGYSNEKRVTDSIFRVMRSNSTNSPFHLTESRELRTVDGRPAFEDHLSGPAILSGAFTAATSMVTLELAHCFNYRMENRRQIGNNQAIVIDYELQPSAVSDEGCPGPEAMQGRAFISPTDFHIIRVEATIPEHEIYPGVISQWTWSINYAPVVFDHTQFWMPKTIVTKAVKNDHLTTWSFAATYSNYHKLTVSSHIVTDVGSNPAPPPQ
jgi:hypothetical protein